jgi:hypothetical protein
MKPRALFLALALASCAALNTARADGPTDNGKLTDAALEKMLVDLGYTPKKTVSADGKRTWYNLVVKQDTFTYVVDVSLDSEGKKVWFSCPLRTLNNPEKVKVERLWKLLEENDNILPMCFSFEKNTKRLYLNHAIDNRGVNARVLREELDLVLGVIRRTYAIWNSNTWEELGGTQPVNPTPVSVVPNKFETPTRQYLMALQQVAGLLATVEDAESAKLAAPQIKEAVAKLKTAIDAMKALGSPSKIEDEDLSKKFGKSLTSTRERVKKDAERIAKLDGAGPALQEAMAELAKIETTLIVAK